MGDVNLDAVDDVFIAYFEDYFSSISGTWQENITSTSGIEMMTGDLVMMAEGLSKSLNVPDTITVLSGTTALDKEGTPDTNTTLLYDLLYQWNADENTIYSNYLFGKIVSTVAKNEPTTRLKKWFDLTEDNAEIMWNLIVMYKDEGTNLEDTYIKAVQTYEERVEFVEEHNI